jgi:hypothetical protein
MSEPRKVEPLTEERAIVWSYGGGVQSAAIAVLVVQGKLPRPERIVMADTGREATATWKWLDEIIQPYLGTVGLRVEIAPHSLASVDLYAESGDNRPLIPAYNDTGGRIPNFCSVEWKRRVVNRWMREQGYGPQRPVREWLGISTDEVHRARPSDLGWIEFHWPLLFDVPMRRSECVQLVRDAGVGTPPRSSCWMCPFRSNEEWSSLRDRGDGDWVLAVALDREIRDKGNGNGSLYLHRTCVALDDDGLALGVERQGAFDFCEEGRCEF